MIQKLFLLMCLFGWGCNGFGAADALFLSDAPLASAQDKPLGDVHLRLYHDDDPEMLTNTKVVMPAIDVAKTMTAFAAFTTAGSLLETALLPFGSGIVRTNLFLVFNGQFCVRVLYGECKHESDDSVPEVLIRQKVVRHARTLAAILGVAGFAGSTVTALYTGLDVFFVYGVAIGAAGLCCDLLSACERKGSYEKQVTQYLGTLLKTSAIISCAGTAASYFFGFTKDAVDVAGLIMNSVTAVGSSAWGWVINKR